MTRIAARSGVMLLAALIGLPAAASAEDRDYCPERPGIDTPPCTIAPGRVSVETAFADWTRDDTPDTRSDTVLIGDTLVRIGIADALEARVGWTPFGHVRTRDKATGAVHSANRVGDVTLGLKYNLHNPDGSGFSVAALPYVSLPVGRTPVGAGDWGAGFLLPVSYELSNRVSLAFTPEVDAAVDEDGNGRHLAYSAAGGLGVKLTDKVTATPELQVLRDDDPDGHTTQGYAALSFAWSATDDLQFDVFGATGVNRASSDLGSVRWRFPAVLRRSA